MEPICQTQSIVELRFSSVKIKQLRRFGRFYLLRVSTSKRSPKRMQLSLIVGIAFGSWLIRFADFRMIRISAFPVFNISGLRVNLHLTLQSRLNSRFIRGCSSEISIFCSKWDLPRWFSDCRANFHLWTVVLPTYLARNVTQFHPFWASNC